MIKVKMFQPEPEPEPQSRDEKFLCPCVSFEPVRNWPLGKPGSRRKDNIQTDGVEE